jgi:competence protein ComEC
MTFDSMMGSLPSTNPLLNNLEDRRVPSIPCRFGQQWSWDGVDFHIWHPHEGTLFEERQTRKPNEMSCVLEIRNQNTSFWLTGDVEKQGEADITARLDQAALNDLKDKKLIFMAPHHGSKTSSSQELLSALNPDQAFTQNGYRNRYGHPHPTVTARFQGMSIPFYQTPDTGAQVWTFYKKGHSLSRPIFWREDYQRLWHRSAVDAGK